MRRHPSDGQHRFTCLRCRLAVTLWGIVFVALAAAIPFHPELAFCAEKGCAEKGCAEKGCNEKTVISEGVRNDIGLLIHDVKSVYQSAATQIKLLLPDELDPNEQYRVLFVLPVEEGNGVRWGDGLSEIRKHDLHNRHNLICVTPTFSDLPWYADHASSSTIRQESFLLKDVVPFIDRTYPTIAKPSGRLLVGFSKSGWGAFSLVLRNPDVFGKAAAWDAPFMMKEPNKYGMGPIFGSQQNFEKYQLTRLIQSKAPTFRHDERLFHFGFGSFQSHHDRLEELLVELKIAHKYRNGPERKHAWESGWLPEAVEALVAVDNT
jgi:S-formylglutathione hydrolase FrmB